MPEPPSRRELLAEVEAEAPRHGASAVRLSIAIAHQLRLPPTDVQCLGLLRDGPATPSELAAQLGLTTGAMTKMVDRLERAGYVWRSADPSDRRRVVVTAVPERLAAVTAHFAPMGEKMSRHLAGRTAGELAVILAFMRAGSEAADEEITRIRAGGARHATRRSARAGQGQA